MARWALVVVSVVVLGIAGYVLFEPVESGRSGRARPAAADGSTAEPGGSRRASSTRRGDSGAALDTRVPGGAPPMLARPRDEPLPPLDPPGTPEAREDARASFEAIIDKLEDIEREGRRLDTSDKERLYREASTAYAALSQHLDARDAGQARYLEETRALMLVKMKAAGITPAIRDERRGKSDRPD